MNFPLPVLRTRTWLRLAAGCCAALLFAAAARSQESTGTVTGTVTNAATGEVLVGAIVKIEGVPTTALSQSDGRYQIAVPVGAHVLSVEFSGLDLATAAVNLSAGATVHRDFAMTSTVYKLDTFSVHGLREATAQALQEQRALPNVAEITSTDAFGIPSANPGMLMMRMPEVAVDIVGANVRTIYLRGMPNNFETLMVDGNLMASTQGTSAGRNLQIEQFGTGNLQQIDVIFEPTPDLDADAIGGIINLVTKRVYDVPDTVQLTLGTAWHDSQDEGAPFHVNPGRLNLINLLASRTFSIGSGKNNLGIEFNFNRNSQASTTEDEEPIDKDLTFAPGGMLAMGAGGNNTGGPLQTAFGSGFFFYPSQMNAGGLNVDYRINDNSFFSIRSTYTQQYYYQQFFREQVIAPSAFSSFLPNSTPDNETTQPGAADATAISSKFTKKSRNYSINPEFSYALFQNTGKLDVNLMYSHANLWYPDYEDVTALDHGVGFNLTRTGQRAWTPAFTQTSGASIYDPNSYVPQQMFRITWGSPDTIAEERVDYRQDFDAPVPGFVKVGFKYSGESHSAYEGIDTLQQYTGPTNQGIGPWLGAYFRPGSYYGPFPFLNIPNNGAANDIVAKGYFAETPANAFANVTTSLGSIANYQEDLIDGYGEASATLGPLTVLGGLRVEETRVEASQLQKTPGAANAALSPAQNEALAAAQFGGLATVTGHYRNVFPGIFLTYEPWSGTIFRGSYNVTITRAPVTNILPGLTINPTSQTISVNNPDLKPYTSQNFEFSASKYFEPVGLLEAGVFLKQVNNYISTQTYAIGSGSNPALDAQYSQYPGYALTTDVNFGNARFRGVYGAYKEQFSFLPGPLAGLGLEGNVTWLETQGNYGGAAFYENLANFTPFTANYGLSYVWRGLQAHLLANYRGDFLLSGNPGTSSAVYQLHRTILNLNADYALDKRWDLFFEADNLTNEYTTAQVFQGKPYSAYKQGIAFSAGVRITFH